MIFYQLLAKIISFLYLHYTYLVFFFSKVIFINIVNSILIADFTIVVIVAVIFFF